jgi:nucleotide-binding universal stress UspA family protein
MRIVMGVDGSDSSRTALKLVTSTRWSTDTSFRLVGAVDMLTDWTAMASPPAADAGDPQRLLFDTIQELAEPLRLQGHSAETVVARGRPADVILAEADDLNADLIVVGRRGLGVAASALLGSVSATLVDHAACPILVARHPRVSRILVATDGSRSAEAIPAVLADWGAFHDAPIHVLSVAPPSSPGEAAAVIPGIWPSGPRVPSASHEVDRHHLMSGEMAAGLVAAGWRAEALVRTGEAAHEIEAAAADLGVDLIITGSRGLSGLRRLLLGSVAHHVLLHSRCSVLVMRGHVPARGRDPSPVTAAASG